jgi:O-antigen/teichoic acid export membrane protein
LAAANKLAGQTLWYGLPTIINRFLGYGLGLMLFGIYAPKETAENTTIYAIIPFLNVLFTYGLETAFFRFVNDEDKDKVYNSFSLAIITTTLVLSSILLLGANFFAKLADVKPLTIKLMTAIVFFDTLAVIPFCKLRNDQQPRKFALINTVSVVVNVFLVWYFLIFSRNAFIKNEMHWYHIFDKKLDIGYFLIANIIASLVKVVMVYKQLLAIKLKFSKTLIKKVLHYSYPFLIIGTAGMTNEMISRIIYRRVATLNPLHAEHELGVFGANFKIAVLVTIFVQIFKMAAEPFFFSVAKNDNAQKTYAKVTKYFVIVCCFIFLGVALFTNIFKLLIAWKKPEYAEGIGVVPILALGYVCLGIYYNLSIWYKLTNNTLKGARITIEASIIAIVSNILLIKLFDSYSYNYAGYFGAAWATCITYMYLMVRCYTMGQKYYKVPYAWKKLVAYIIICILLIFIQKMFVLILQTVTGSNTIIWYHVTGLLLIGAFAWFIIQIERKELAKMPYINRFIKA